MRQLKSTGGCQTRYTGATGIQEQRAMFQKEEKNLALESFLLDKDVLPLYKLEPKKLFYPTKVCIFYPVSCEITKYIFELKNATISHIEFKIHGVIFPIDENNYTSKSRIVNSLENGENEGAEAKSNSLLATKIIWRVKGCLTHSHEADDTGKSLRLSKRVRRNIGLLLKLDLPMPVIRSKYLKVENFGGSSGKIPSIESARQIQLGAYPAPPDLSCPEMEIVFRYMRYSVSGNVSDSSI